MPQIGVAEAIKNMETERIRVAFQVDTDHIVFFRGVTVLEHRSET